MDNDLTAARLAAHDNLIAARSALQLSYERWTAARTELGFPTNESRAAREAAKLAAVEYENAVAEYARLIDPK